MSDSPSFHKFSGAMIRSLPAIFLAVIVFSPPGMAADTKHPNIIVILTDDMGYADLRCQNAAEDPLTPNLDRMASEGVRCTASYVTAPQCSPSRAGLMTGRYQQRFGFDAIPDCPLPLEEVTIAERLHAAGYISGLVGKWHLDPNVESAKWIAKNLPDVKRNARGEVLIPKENILAYYPRHQGFDEFFVGTNTPYYANFSVDGGDLNCDGQMVADNRFRVDTQTEAALAFIQRNHSKPFFLYLAYFAPHVPLEATEKYLALFPGKMPERRRHALAMIAAVDDGVGRILAALKDNGVDDNTLLIFTSDNGAPLKLTKNDTLPVNVSSPDWDGSLNDPWTGEKGMLAEGGIRVPFLLRWKNALPAGKVFKEPVSTLDIAATAIAAAGLPADAKLDGVNLIPYLDGQNSMVPHETLFWRFWNQAAIRDGKWKYIKAGPSEFLFDLESDGQEIRNLLPDHAELAGQLRSKLTAWTRELTPAGIPATPFNSQEEKWYEFYFHTPAGKEASPSQLPPKKTETPNKQKNASPDTGFPLLGGQWTENPIPVLGPHEKPVFSLMIDADDTGGRANYAYAYSPTIIRENGRYHAFVGSPGDVQGKNHGEWDYIRYVSSVDGQHWTKPVVALKTNSDKRGLDYSACDPSMVFFQGYYYLFYSGAENVRGPVSAGMNKKEVVTTVVRVARAQQIEGPYLKWTRRGTWEADASDPAAIVKPLGDPGTPTQRYGAGQQSVVVRDGKIWMWYLDDTGEKGRKIYLLKSDNPVQWTPDPSAATDNGVVGLDVKFDPRTNLFWTLALPRVAKNRPESAMVLSFSADGVSWPPKAKTTLVDVSRMASFVRVEGGISGDREGHILSGMTLFSFPAPHGLAGEDNVPVWDLYSFAVQNASEKLLVSGKP